MVWHTYERGQNRRCQRSTPLQWSDNADCIVTHPVVAKPSDVTRGELYLGRNAKHNKSGAV